MNEDDTNEVRLSGLVINLPVLSILKDGPILSFAVESLDGPHRLIMRVDVRGARATELHATLSQEDYVLVEGRLRYAKWTNKRGERHETNLIEAERVAVEPQEG